MKKLLVIVVLILIWSNSSKAKILNVGSHQLEVPNKFYLIDWSSSSLDNWLSMCQVDSLDNCYGIVDKKAKEIIDRLDAGESYEDIKVLKPLVSLLKKIELNYSTNSYKKFFSKLKSILKKNNSGTIFNFYTSKQDGEDLLNDFDFDFTIEEIRSMSKSELVVLTKKFRAELTSLSRSGNYIPINDDLTLKLNKFKISKTSNGTPYLIILGKFSYVLGPHNLTGDLAGYVSESNDKAFVMDGICLADCSKFNSTFNQIVNNSFHKKKFNSSFTTSSENDFIEQLKQLNELYKSGILTKEEFEKAKKKLLN